MAPNRKLLAEGQISPAEEQAAAPLLEAHHRAFEIKALEIHLNALEAQLHKMADCIERLRGGGTRRISWCHDSLEHAR